MRACKIKKSKGELSEPHVQKIFQPLVVMLVVSFSLAPLLVSYAQVTENFWAIMADMPTARAGIGVAVVEGKIYAIGGSYNSHGENEEYDPITNTWTTKTPMPTPRIYFGIAVVENKIYTIGGDSGNWTAGQTVTNVNEVYDPATDTWETKASMPTKRMAVSAEVVDGRIYLIGGGLTATEVYDPSTDTWTTEEPMPTAVGYQASVVVDKKIYVIGGAVEVTLNQIYDTETDTWSNGTPLPKGVDAAAAVATTGVYAPKRIYVIGGKQNLDAVNVNQIYNPETDAWSIGAAMPTARYGLGVAVINDILYAIGGREGWFGSPISAANEQYTPIGFGTASPDTVPPVISVVSPENKTYTANSVSLTFAGSEPIFSMKYSLDRQANITITGNTTLTGLSDGSHSLTVYANDLFGNIGSSDTSYFTIDATFPSISILSPENKTYDTTDIPLNFTVSESVSWIGYSLDGEANVTITGDTLLTSLLVGSHYVVVYANDTVGHMGVSGMVSFTVDTTSPTVSVLSPENITYTANNVSLTFTVNEQTSWIGYSLDEQANVTITENTTLTGLSNEIHRLTVYAKDIAGNTGSSETIYFTIAQKGPFPTWVVAAIVIVAIGGVAFLVYFRKVKTTTRKGE